MASGLAYVLKILGEQMDLNQVNNPVDVIGKSLHTTYRASHDLYRQEHQSFISFLRKCYH